MNKLTKLTLAASAVYLLSACGGGGGGGGNGLSATLSIFSPSSVEASQLTEGIRSGNTDNNYGSGTIILPVRSSFGKVVREKNSFIRFSTIHVSDTKANLAWQDGWTGSGKTISIIDDFQTSDIQHQITGVIERNIARTDFSAFDGIYNVNYNLTIQETHGDIVATIAGGSGAGVNVQERRDMIATANNLKLCQSGSCPLSESNFLLEAENTQFNYTKSAGVAKDSLVIMNHVDLSRNQNPESTLAAIRSHVDNSFNHAAINLSVGLNIDTVGMSLDQALSFVDNDSLTRMSDAVIVVAAGNEGAACTQNNLNGCNFLAVAASVLPQTRESVIIAGATQGSESSESIASYSARAGVLRDRFLLAPGGTGKTDRHGDEIQGTSFAAPRITGSAALLRHKFPNLSGQQAASILLLTANKDINNNGTPDFTGVSDVFGHGKLDLMKALSPVGTLSIR